MAKAKVHWSWQIWEQIRNDLSKSQNIGGCISPIGGTESATSAQNTALFISGNKVARS